MLRKKRKKEDINKAQDTIYSFGLINTKHDSKHIFIWRWDIVKLGKNKNKK